MRTPRIASPSLFLVLFVGLGCSSSGDPAAIPGTDSGADSVTPDALAVLDGTPETAEEICTEPVEERPPLSSCIRQVKGQAVDVSGAPLPKLVISVCGGICYFGETKADGTFDTPVGTFINPDSFAVLIHGRPLYASLYESLPTPPAGSQVIVMPKPIAVPRYDATGPDLPADGASAGTASAGPVTIGWPDDTDFDLDVEDVLDEATGRKIKSARWADLSTPPSFAIGQGIVQLYGLAPFDMKICAERPCEKAAYKKMSVTVLNEATPPLAAGTVVEFLVLETDLASVPFTAGKAKVAAVGKVSADGKTISTDAGEGVTTLTWIGIRPKK